MVSCMLELRQRMKMPDGYIASKKKKKRKKELENDGEKLEDSSTKRIW